MINQLLEELFKPLSKEGKVSRNQDLIKKGVEKLYWRGKSLQTFKFSGTIEVPVSGTIEIGLYDDELRGELSDAKDYEIQYDDRREMEAVIARQIAEIVAEVTHDDIDVSSTKHIGDTASIGFSKSIGNKKYTDNAYHY